MSVTKIYIYIIRSLFNLSLNTTKYFENKYSKLINQQINKVTQLSHIENHKFTIFKSFIKPHK